MQRLYFIRFFKPVLALIMALVAAAAFALPNPKDIENAVNAGHLTQAESMLREVIQEKPQSAKAQYELGQVLARQARFADAEKALTKAKELDPSLKFAVSPDKFNDTFDKVARQARDLTGAQVGSGLNNVSRAPAQAAPSAAESPFPLHYIWIGIGALLILALVLRRNKASAQVGTPYAPTSPAGAPSATAFGNMNPQPAYGPQGYPNQMPPAGMGSGIGGAVIGGLAGVAAGYALSKALEGDHHSNPANAAGPSPAGNNGYVPFDTPSQPDLGSFDSGSGSGWDDAGSDSGSDDNW